MFLKLGAGWSCTLLGLLCVVFFPAPVIFYVRPCPAAPRHLSRGTDLASAPLASQVYGARIRKWSKYVPAPLDETGGVDSEKGLSTSASPSASNLAATRTASPEALSRPPSPAEAAPVSAPHAVVSSLPTAASPLGPSYARRQSSRSSSSSILEEDEDAEDGGMSRLSSRRGTTRRPSVVPETAERPHPTSPPTAPDS
jgi:hypothetical protein